MRVVFVGHPGSGKTYAATSLAKRARREKTDIDDLLHNSCARCTEALFASGRLTNYYGSIWKGRYGR